MQTVLWGCFNSYWTGSYAIAQRSPGTIPSSRAEGKGRDEQFAGLGTHHLVRGRPHHARQHVQQVLSLEKLEHKGQTQITAEQTTAKNSFLTPNLSFPCVTNPAQKQAHSASEQFLRALFPRVRWAVGLLHPRCRALYFPLLFFLGIPAGGKGALQPTVTSVHTTPLASVLFLQALALWCQL